MSVAQPFSAEALESQARPKASEFRRGMLH